MWPESGKATRHAPRAYSDLSIEVCIISVDTRSRQPVAPGRPHRRTDAPLRPGSLPGCGNSVPVRLVQLPRFDVGAPSPASGETSGPGRPGWRSKGGYRRQPTYVRLSAGQGHHAQVPLRIRRGGFCPAPRGAPGLRPVVLDPASSRGGQGRRGGAEGGTAPPSPSSAPGVDHQEDPRREEGPPRRTRSIQPKEVPQEKPKEAETARTSPRGVEGGVDGGVVGGVVGWRRGRGGRWSAGQHARPCSFGEGMTRPELQSSPNDRPSRVHPRGARGARAGH